MSVVSNVQRALFEEEYEKDAQLSKHAMSDFDESMRSLETSSRGQVKADDETCTTFPRCGKNISITYNVELFVHNNNVI